MLTCCLLTTKYSHFPIPLTLGLHRPLLLPLKLYPLPLQKFPRVFVLIPAVWEVCIAHFQPIWIVKLGLFWTPYWISSFSRQNYVNLNAIKGTNIRVINPEHSRLVDKIFAFSSLWFEKQNGGQSSPKVERNSWHVKNVYPCWKGFTISTIRTTVRAGNVLLALFNLACQSRLLVKVAKSKSQNPRLIIIKTCAFI